RAANVSIGVIGETREVRVPIGESKKASSIDYEVNRISRSNSNYGYDHIPPNVNSRVGTAARARERLSEAFRLDQKWFGKGTRKEAMAFIRQRISRARSRVIIADPYFGILQIPQYLLAITSNDVKIELLTSRLAFESSTPTDEDGGVENFSTSVEAKVRQFNEEVERIKKGGNSD
ncbi:VPA1262 family N-terminal domain-containing protein, partial [Vibrio parahaemolyticus]|nr:VPA1262 family N-terminal domain-containing protein [Vibrio parahaemolyticus]